MLVTDKYAIISDCPVVTVSEINRLSQRMAIIWFTEMQLDHS